MANALRFMPLTALYVDNALSRIDVRYAVLMEESPVIYNRSSVPDSNTPPSGFSGLSTKRPLVYLE